MQHHGFYLVLSYGVGALALLLEIAVLARRCHKLRMAREQV